MPTSASRLDRFARFFRAVSGRELEDFQRLIVSELFAGRRELLVLIPRGNGKTTLLAAIALFLLLTEEKPSIYVAAASRDQASLTFDAARDMVRAQPQIEARVQIRFRELRVAGGALKVLAADAPKLHGLIPTFALIDELHAHRNSDLYVALKTAMGKIETAQLATISTAGTDTQGVLGLLRAQALALPNAEREGRRTIARKPESDFAFIEWACTADDDLTDAAVVKQANPATFVRESFLAEQIASPGLHPAEFARYHANVWSDHDDRAWIEPHAWDGCYVEDVGIPEGADVWVAVDAAYRRDCAAVAVVSPQVIDRRDRLVVDGMIFQPNPNQPLDLGLVEDAVRSLGPTWAIREVGYDRHLFARSAEMLADEGLPMTEFPQTPARMSPASQGLYDAINTKRLAQAGDAEMAAHINAGATTETDRGWRLTKRRSKRPIDFAIALAMAVDLCDEGVTVSAYEEHDLLIL